SEMEAGNRIDRKSIALLDDEIARAKRHDDAFERRARCIVVRHVAGDGAAQRILGIGLSRKLCESASAAPRNECRLFACELLRKPFAKTRHRRKRRERRELRKLGEQLLDDAL